MLVIERLTGRLTSNPRVNEVKDKQVVNFSIAINDKYKPKGGELTEVTTYVDCAFWNNPGVAEYLKKGSLVELSGRLGVKAYMGTGDEPKAGFRLTVNRIKFLTSGKSEAPAHPEPATGNGKRRTGGKKNNASTVKTGADITEPIDDLPF